MEIVSISTGSTGNAYFISDGRSSLLLDAGVPVRKIQVETHFRVSQIAGVLVTHEHMDHCKAAKDLARLGLDVYASAGTLRACGLSGHRFHPVKALQEVEIGTFTVIPFPLEHDAAEPLGFLCYSRETGEKLLYFTDTYYIRNRFSGVTHIIGECNYDAETLWKAVEDGSTPAAAAKRIFYSHMSLENLCDFLRANDLRRLRKIYVCHMSDRHGSEEKIKREIKKVTGVEVYIL